MPRRLVPRSSQSEVGSFPTKTGTRPQAEFYYAASFWRN